MIPPFMWAMSPGKTLQIGLHAILRVMDKDEFAFGGIPHVKVYCTSEKIVHANSTVPELRSRYSKSCPHNKLRYTKAVFIYNSHL